MVGKLVVDMPTWKSEAAKDPNLVTVNGAAMKLTQQEREWVVDNNAQLLKDFSFEIRADGTFTLTCILGKVKGNWVMDGERLVATPIRCEPTVACTNMTAKPFWLIRDGNSIRCNCDGQSSHSMPLIMDAGTGKGSNR